LGLTAHLLDEDSISSFRIRVPFRALIAAGMESLESGDRVWLTGQEEEGRLPRAGINLVFLPFERELGPTDAEAPEKGKQLW